MPAAQLQSLLVLCVDRDDDIGSKAGVSTPAVGKEACLEAAARLALADPEEADANSLFAAVGERNRLNERGFQAEVALVAGRKFRGTEGDQKLRGELLKVLENYRADGLVLVSDGVEDEAVLPILQSVLPVVSVKRIVVKHSASVEISYAILGRYLKMLVQDPRFTRYTLGVPGILLLVYGVLVALDQLRVALVATAVILGGAFVVKGFEIDRLLSLITRLTPAQYYRLFTGLTSILLGIAAFAQGYNVVVATPEARAAASSIDLFIRHFTLLAGIFLESAAFWLWVAFGIGLGGSLLYHALYRNPRGYRDAVGLVVLIVLYFPILEFARFLKNPASTPLGIVFWALVGLAVSFMIVGMVAPALLERREIERGSPSQ